MASEESTGGEGKGQSVAVLLAFLEKKEHGGKEVLGYRNQKRAQIYIYIYIYAGVAPKGRGNETRCISFLVCSTGNVWFHSTSHFPHAAAVRSLHAYHESGDV